MKKEEPRKEVTKQKPVAELDARAQERANMLSATYGWELYTFRDGTQANGRDIVSANLPFADDTRDWYCVVFDEGRGEG